MADDPYNPDYDYLAFIDEAGETGLDRVRGVDATGSSEWFILSIVLVPKHEEPNIGDWVRDMIQKTRSHQLQDIHFARMPERYKAVVSETLARKRVRCFVVCSNKKNMRQHRNKRAEKMGVQDWYYCWITRVALERASNFVWRRSVQNHGSPRRMKLVFSERSGLRIGQMGAYYHWIKQQSLNDNLYLPWGDVEWETIHSLLISKDFHKNLPGLKLADIVASAFFAACDNKQSGPCQPRYAECLKPIMARYPHNEEGRYSGYGLKLLPNWSKAKLSADQQVVFRRYGYPAQLWQKGRRWELPPPR